MAWKAAASLTELTGVGPGEEGKPPGSATEAELSFFQGSVDILILLVLFQLCFHQDLTDVHHFLHSQSEAFHWVAEFLKRP